MPAEFYKNCPSLLKINDIFIILSHAFFAHIEYFAFTHNYLACVWLDQ